MKTQLRINELEAALEVKSIAWTMSDAHHLRHDFTCDLLAISSHLDSINESMKVS